MPRPSQTPHRRTFARSGLRGSALARFALAPMAALLLMGQTDPDLGIEIEPVPSPEELRSEAFVAAQYSLISGAAAAVDRVTARFTSGAGPLAALEAERDAKLLELQQIDRQFTALIERGGELDEDTRRNLSERRRVVRDEVTKIEDRIAVEFPQYFELTRPKPLDIAQTQALLNPDEALLMILVSDDAAYIWAVSRDKAIWARSEAMAEAELAKKVTALRASMEVDNARGKPREDTRGRPRQPGDPTAATPPESADDRPAFNRALAHEIYKELIAPVESVLQGKEVVLTNVTGALTSLPLSMLVTTPPQGSDLSAADVAGTDWLIDRYALAELPSVSSLRALRCLLIANKAAAHPGCKSVAVSNNHARARQGSIVLAGYGAPMLEGIQGDARSAPPDLGQVYDGKLADTEKLRALAYLPEAQAELDSLGSQFGDRALIVTGDDATESAVKTSSAIPQARFLVFSTHGLLATEVGDNAEPGLVFTPPSPDDKSELDDGLLTASEAAQLQLSADLVVLSACNTAAGDGRPGAEGLSGLARAFFFAGARSMLVSHWSVSDAATSLLMQQTFQNIQSGDIAGRARALQSAMQYVRNVSTGNFTSPKYWAAFSLVGEPGS